MRKNTLGTYPSSSLSSTREFVSTVLKSMSSKVNDNALVSKFGSSMQGNTRLALNGWRFIAIYSLKYKTIMQASSWICPRLYSSGLWFLQTIAFPAQACICVCLVQVISYLHSDPFRCHSYCVKEYHTLWNRHPNCILWCIKKSLIYKPVSIESMLQKAL